MRILPFLGGQLQKIVYFYPHSFNAKTDQLFFLIAMVCKTWRWYYQFQIAAPFPKSDEKDRISNKNADFTDFRQLSGKNCEILPQSVLAKTDRLSFPIVVVYET